MHTYPSPTKVCPVVSKDTNRLLTHTKDAIITTGKRPECREGVGCALRRGGGGGGILLSHNSVSSHSVVVILHV